MIKVPRRLFALSFKPVRLSFGHDARAKIAKGIRVMADVTSKTYGPGGRNVALEYENGDPKITKDGVTVAKSVFFKDREEELGAKLLKRISHSTNTYAGDGTTLSTFFSANLVDKACKAIENGVEPIHLKFGIEKSKRATLEILQQFVMPVTNKKELHDVCLVSSNYNEEIADIVTEAISNIDMR